MRKIPLGISKTCPFNKEHLEILFGEGYELTK